MKKHYFVIVEKEKTSCYGVYSPDLKGVIGAGDTFTEAVDNMREAMENYLDEVKIVPDAAKIETIENYIINNYPSRSVKTIVDLEVELPNTHSVRLNISMPEDVLSRLDQQLAGKTNQRSRFITNAVEKQLQQA
jgi:predicted RNase H-like HicB family nuclease